jgi:dynactin 1
VRRTCIISSSYDYANAFLFSFLSQLNHLAQTVFTREEVELGERQLGFAVAFDYELDNFAAAVGFARYIIQHYIADQGKSLRAS